MTGIKFLFRVYGAGLDRQRPWLVPYDPELVPARKRPGDQAKAWTFPSLALVAAAICIFGAPSE